MKGSLTLTLLNELKAMNVIAEHAEDLKAPEVEEKSPSPSKAQV